MSARPVAVKKPSVSVLMPVFNGEAFVRSAIDGILVQTLRDFELIVIDDGSTDRTSAILSEYNDPRIVRLRHEQNRGLIAALNEGLAMARGEFVARQDADDVSLPERLQIQSDFLNAHPDVSVVSSAWLLESEEGMPRAVRRVEADPFRIAWILLFSCPVAHASVMFHRDIVLRLGGYREGDLFVEDFALWGRIARFSKISAVDRPLVIRRRPKTSITAMHGAEMAEAARRISLENLAWVAGGSLAVEDLDALQALCGNRSLSLEEALRFEFSKRRISDLAECIFREQWRNREASLTQVRKTRRWAMRWVAGALIRRSHFALTESALSFGRKRSDGLRIARYLAVSALRISPSILGSRKETGMALRALAGRV